jgi:hypothetical protein
MTQNDPSFGRREYRLGLLNIVTESTVFAKRIENWLPRTGGSTDYPSSAELWVGGAETQSKIRGSARVIYGGVALWMNDGEDHASLLSPAGHAELDLSERWGRVSPADTASGLSALLSASAAILMARAGVALLNASAIIDTSGGGWLILGPREARAKVVRAFVSDGCDFVSDDQLAVRYAHHQSGLVILESWHRTASSSSGLPGEMELPPERWKPTAQLRGVLLARSIVSRTPLAWRGVTREHALESLIDAVPHFNSDSVTTDPLRELMASCATHLTIVALLNRERDFVSGGAVRDLASAIDGIL